MIPILNSFLVSRNQSVSLMASELLSKIEKKIVSELFTYENDEYMINELLNNAPIRCEDVNHILKELEVEKSIPEELPNVILQVNSNIVDTNHKKLFPFDSKQTTLLFKGYLFNEEMDCTEKLQNGFYCNEFYQKTYNKFNNLDQGLAWKRKKVCKKLLNILRILVINN